jgi:hypothetical protein
MKISLPHPTTSRALTKKFVAVLRGGIGLRPRSKPEDGAPVLPRERCNDGPRPKFKHNGDKLFCQSTRRHLAPCEKQLSWQ